MSSIQYVGTVISALADVFQPLEDSLEAGQTFSAFLADFGWSLDPQSDANAIASAFGSIPPVIAAVRDAATAFNSAETSGGNVDYSQLVADLTVAVGKVAETVKALTSTTPNSIWPPPLNSAQFWEIFPIELLDSLLCRYLERTHPRIATSARLLGFIDKQYSIPSATNWIPYNRVQIRWDRVVLAITRPQDIPKEVYGWGDAFDVHGLLCNVRDLAVAFDRAAVIHDAPQGLLDHYYDQGAAGRKEAFELAIPLYWEILAIGHAFSVLELEFAVLPIPPAGNRSASAVGLALYPRVTGTMSETFQITDGLSLQVGGDLSSGAPVRVEIRPDSVNIALDPNLVGPIDAFAKLDATPTPPWIPIGHANSSRVELRHAHAALKATGPIQDLEFIIEAAADEAALIIQFDEGDGFLQQILGGSPKTISLSLSVSWSSKLGIRIGGQGKLEVTIPVHASIAGVIDIDSLTISVGASTDPAGVGLGVSVTGGINIGPVAASIDRVGVQAKLGSVAPGQPPGNLGNIDLAWAFLPPKGLGLSIDAGAVAGGGYILFDQEKGEYAGFLDISIVDIVQVKFIAILDTKLPDGSEGYSFIFIIFLELPPIQLGYGFTLNGVGGVAGINRTMVTTALQAGVYNHTLEYVINPPHTVADAPKVISAVSSFFPPATGRYVFGPIVAIGWETFVQLTVGVILEVPDPIRLALLGIIDVGVPDVEEPDDAVVLLHILVLGTLDFGTKKLAIDGSMYGSRILEFPILGDFALRTSWGTNPSSLFSMGEFNPHFNTSGLDVPQLHRMSISIGDGDNPQISANSYLALTSNTIQFGADVEVNVSEGGFKVHGYLGFDVLFVIAPPTISFEFDFAAGFDISYNGANLAGLTVTGTLTGTTPWHIHGEATVHLLCFSASKSVDKTWGDSITPLPPPAAILPDLVPALADSRNWSATLPEGASLGATLSAPAADQKTILVHPMGTLAVRQKIVPFDLSVTHYKNGIPSDGGYFSLGDVSINGVKVSRESFQDSFATGQFIDLSDADKLNRSSFDLYNAGAKIASANVNAGADATRTVESNEYYLDDELSPLRLSGIYVMPAGVFGVLSQQSAGSGISVKNTGLNKYKTGPSTPSAITKEPSYIVASTTDLSVRSDIAAGDATYYQALGALRTHLAANPQDARELQILPAHEVTA